MGRAKRVLGEQVQTEQIHSKVLLYNGAVFQHLTNHNGKGYGKMNIYTYVYNWSHSAVHKVLLALQINCINKLNKPKLTDLEGEGKNTYGLGVFRARE